MSEEKKPKCEDIGFAHAWEDASYPYCSPDGVETIQRRRCLNCGRVEQNIVVQREIREWQEVTVETFTKVMEYDTFRSTVEAVVTNGVVTQVNVTSQAK